MNREILNGQSQEQDNLIKGTNVSGNLTFAPVQNGTKIETQIVKNSEAKVTQQPLIKTSPLSKQIHSDAKKRPYRETLTMTNRLILAKSDRNFPFIGYALAATVISPLLAGCGLTSQQKQATATFASATDRLGDAASREFPEIRNQVIAIDTTRVTLEAALSNEDVPPNEYVPPYLDLDRAIDSDEVAVRVEAANVLKNYGALLHALATDSQQEALAKASTNLTTAIGALPADQQKLSGEQLQIAGQLIAEIGFLFVESKKAKVLKKVVPLYSSQVETIATMIAEDFNKDNPKFSGQLKLVNSDLKAAITQALEPSGSSVNDSSVKLESRDALRLWHKNQDRIETIHPTIVDAANKVSAAHTALENALATDTYSFDDILEYSSAVEALVSTLKL